MGVIEKKEMNIWYSLRRQNKNYILSISFDVFSERITILDMIYL